MEQGKRKVVWFNIATEKDILSHAENQSNFSRYVKKLIKDDITFQQTGVDPKVLEHIEMIIESRLANITNTVLPLHGSSVNKEIEPKISDNIWGYF
jgi:hypothetical protein